MTTLQQAFPFILWSLKQASYGSVLLRHKSKMMPPIFGLSKFCISQLMPGLVSTYFSLASSEGGHWVSLLPTPCSPKWHFLSQCHISFCIILSSFFISYPFGPPVLQLLSWIKMFPRATLNPNSSCNLMGYVYPGRRRRLVLRYRHISSPDH